MADRVAKLGEVATFLNGGTPDRSVTKYYEGDIPWVTSADLSEEGGLITQSRFCITEEAIAASATRVIPKENILLVSRTGVGKVAITGINVCISQDFTGIIPDKSVINLGYLFRYLQARKSYFVSHQRGATIKGITRRVISDLEIPLPPLPQQRHIAAVLDKADALRQKRRAALSKLDTLLQSLFLDLFGDPVTNPKGWKTDLLEAVIIDGPQNGLYRPASDYGSGTPIIRIDSFYDGRVTNLHGLKRVRIEEEILERYQVRENDILINRVNSRQYLGKSAIVSGLLEPTVFESNMMRFTVDHKQVHPQYLIALLQHRFIKRQVLSRSRDAVNQSSINQGDVKGIEIRLPPILLQQEFITVSQTIEQMKKQFSRSVGSFDSLFGSLQQRAFRGEL